MNIKTIGAAVLAGAVVAGCGPKAADGDHVGKSQHFSIITATMSKATVTAILMI